MTTTRTILVTGGTGFIGRHLVRQLLQQGCRVRVFCRSTAKATRLFSPAVESVEGDLLDAASVRRAVAGAGVVYHLGGLYEFGPGARQALYAVNREGTHNLMQAAWEARAERVIHCSTAGLLGTGTPPIDTTQFPRRVPRGCHYKGSKWEAECVALDWQRRGLPVVIASPTAPIGPGDERPTPTGRLIRDLVCGRLPAYSRTGLNLVAVEDVARGLAAMLDRGEVGQRYILGGVDYWLGGFLAEVARVAGLRAPRWEVPWAAVAAAGWAGEWIGRFGGPSSSRFCWETAVFARKRQFFDLRRTREVLGWHPTGDLTATVAAAVNWFRERNGLAAFGTEARLGLPGSVGTPAQGGTP